MRLRNMAKLSVLISVEYALKLFDGVGVLVRLFDLGSQKKVFRRLCLDLSSFHVPASSVIVIRLEFVDAKHSTRCGYTVSVPPALSVEL